MEQKFLREDKEGREVEGKTVGETKSIAKGRSKNNVNAIPRCDVCPYDNLPLMK